MTDIENVIKLISATKSETPQENKYSHHDLIYWNLFWVICILVICLVIVLSQKVTDLSSDRLISILTNFSTLLSIVLSISSILFAYYTSRDTNNQYVAMGKALAEIRAASYQSIINNSDLITQVESIARDVSVLNSKYDLQSFLSKNTKDTSVANSDIVCISGLNNMSRDSDIAEIHVANQYIIDSTT